MAGKLIISTLSDGNNETPVTDIVLSKVRAWVNFNGIGSLFVNESYNVSSVSDNGVGDYTINFASPMPDSNYAMLGTGALLNGSGRYYGGQVAEKMTSAASVDRGIWNITIHTCGVDGIALADGLSVNVAVFR